jgi:hypothetical protein
MGYIKYDQVGVDTHKSFNIFTDPKTKFLPKLGYVKKLLLAYLMIVPTTSGCIKNQ